MNIIVGRYWTKLYKCRFWGYIISIIILCIPGLAVFLTYLALKEIWFYIYAQAKYEFPENFRTSTENDVLACIGCIIINLAITVLMYGWL